MSKCGGIKRRSVRDMQERLERVMSMSPPVREKAVDSVVTKKRRVPLPVAATAPPPSPTIKVPTVKKGKRAQKKRTAIDMVVTGRHINVEASDQIGLSDMTPPTQPWEPLSWDKWVMQNDNRIISIMAFCVKRMRVNAVNPKHLLVVGPRGSGKSLAMKLIADKIGTQLYSLTDIVLEAVADRDTTIARAINDAVRSACAPPDPGVPFHPYIVTLDHFELLRGVEHGPLLRYLQRIQGKRVPPHVIIIPTITDGYISSAHLKQLKTMCTMVKFPNRDALTNSKIFKACIRAPRCFSVFGKLATLPLDAVRHFVKHLADSCGGNLSVAFNTMVMMNNGTRAGLEDIASIDTDMGFFSVLDSILFAHPLTLIQGPMSAPTAAPSSLLAAPVPTWNDTLRSFEELDIEAPLSRCADMLPTRTEWSPAEVHNMRVVDAHQRRIEMDIHMLAEGTLNCMASSMMSWCLSKNSNETLEAMCDLMEAQSDQDMAFSSAMRVGTPISAMVASQPHAFVTSYALQNLTRTARTAARGKVFVQGMFPSSYVTLQFKNRSSPHMATGEFCLCKPKRWKAPSRDAQLAQLEDLHDLKALREFEAKETKYRVTDTVLDYMLRAMHTVPPEVYLNLKAAHAGGVSMTLTEARELAERKMIVAEEEVSVDSILDGTSAGAGSMWVDAALEHHKVEEVTDLEVLQKDLKHTESARFLDNDGCVNLDGLF